MSEQTEFLKDLDGQTNDVLNAPLEDIAPEKENDDDGEGEMKLKNRRERRLASRLQSEREANIALNARLQGISEARKFTEEVGVDDPIKAARSIYGDDTPEKKQASDILESTLRKIQDAAVEKALERIRAEQGDETEAVYQEEENLDTMMDEVEDAYGIDFSNAQERRGFLTLLEKASPKDRSGNIIEFADPDAIAELYLTRKEKAQSRAKELSSRSMVRSGSSQASKIEDDAAVRFLKENGII